MLRFVSLVALSIVVAFAAAGCSSSSDSASTVSGIVTEVNGDLTTVESFVVLDSSGRSHKFVPMEGLLFYGGPLPHLRDHVVTGQVIKVTFEEGAEGEKIAVLIEHADGDSTHEMPAGDMDMGDMGGDSG